MKYGLAVVAVLTLALVLGFVWFGCRIYVPQGHMAIVTAKTGDPLPEGAILAEPGQRVATSLIRSRMTGASCRSSRFPPVPSGW